MRCARALLRPPQLRDRTFAQVTEEDLRGGRLPSTQHPNDTNTIDYPEFAISDADARARAKVK